VEFGFGGEGAARVLQGSLARVAHRPPESVAHRVRKNVPCGTPTPFPQDTPAGSGCRRVRKKVRGGTPTPFRCASGRGGAGVYGGGRAGRGLVYGGGRRQILRNVIGGACARAAGGTSSAGPVLGLTEEPRAA
jgi:hypothetical protein